MKAAFVFLSGLNILNLLSIFTLLNEIFLVELFDEGATLLWLQSTEPGGVDLTSSLTIAIKAFPLHLFSFPEVTEQIETLQWNNYVTVGAEEEPKMTCIGALKYCNQWDFLLNNVTHLFLNILRPHVVLHWRENRVICFWGDFIDSCDLFLMQKLFLKTLVSTYYILYYILWWQNSLYL